LDVVNSVHGVPIRLTDERWEHITSGHQALATMKAEVLATVQFPTVVVEGSYGEMLAVRRWDRLWLVVPYREVSEGDGFVITAFLSRFNPASWRTVLWLST
jgi:hypothetical protein